MKDKAILAEKIMEALPQLQCKKCDYDDCKSYVNAIINDKEELNKCEPGSIHTETQIKNIINNNGQIKIHEIKSYEIATIDLDECIGCTICIKVCPVDAIIGAKQQKHFIINDLCNGCELCIKQCPVDCMEMIPNVENKSWSWPGIQSQLSNANYYEKIKRLDKIKNAKKLAREQSYEKRKIEMYLKDAINRESLKKNKIKEYE